MGIRHLRLQRGWSQDDLARLSGLSERTIQRIERGDRAGLESVKALASVFEVSVAELRRELEEPDTLSTTDERRRSEGEEIRGFWIHAFIFCVGVGGLFLLNRMMSPGFIWAWWPALGWACGLAVHGLEVFQAGGVRRPARNGARGHRDAPEGPGA